MFSQSSNSSSGVAPMPGMGTQLEESTALQKLFGLSEDVRPGEAAQPFAPAQSVGVVDSGPLAPSQRRASIPHPPLDSASSEKMATERAELRTVLQDRDVQCVALKSLEALASAHEQLGGVGASVGGSCASSDAYILSAAQLMLGIDLEDTINIMLIAHGRGCGYYLTENAPPPAPSPSLPSSREQSLVPPSPCPEPELTDLYDIADYEPVKAASLQGYSVRTPVAEFVAPTAGPRSDTQGSQDSWEGPLDLGVMSMFPRTEGWDREDRGLPWPELVRYQAEDSPVLHSQLTEDSTSEATLERGRARDSLPDLELPAGKRSLEDLHMGDFAGMPVGWRSGESAVAMHPHFKERRKEATSWPNYSSH